MGCAYGSGAFELTIRMTGEPALRSREHGLVRRPGPTTKARALIVLKRLMDLITSIHDKGPVLRDRFGNRTSLQQQELARVGSILKTNFRRSIKVNGGMPFHGSIV